MISACARQPFVHFRISFTTAQNVTVDYVNETENGTANATVSRIVCGNRMSKYAVALWLL